MTKNKKIIKEIFGLSIPIILSNILSAAAGFISMLLIAKVNPNALAAGAIITSTYGLVMMMAISFFLLHQYFNRSL